MRFHIPERLTADLPDDFQGTLLQHQNIQKYLYSIVQVKKIQVLITSFWFSVISIWFLVVLCGILVACSLQDILQMPLLFDALPAQQQEEHRTEQLHSKCLLSSFSSLWVLTLKMCFMCCFFCLFSLLHSPAPFFFIKRHSLPATTQDDFSLN